MSYFKPVVWTQHMSLISLGSGGECLKQQGHKHVLLQDDVTDTTHVPHQFGLRGRGKGFDCGRRPPAQSNTKFRKLPPLKSVVSAVSPGKMLHGKPKERDTSKLNNSNATKTKWWRGERCWPPPAHCNGPQHTGQASVAFTDTYRGKTKQNSTGMLHHCNVTH